MIKSKGELRRIANGVATQIKNDMRSRIVGFMEQMGTDEVELASALDITVDELEQILSGNGEITLTTFAKLIVASEHTIEIKALPVVGQRNSRMPNRSENVRQNHQRTSNRPNRVVVPSYEEFQKMMHEGKIPPPPQGFMGCGIPRPSSRQNDMGSVRIPHCQELQHENVMELDSMTRRDLVNTIVNNDWQDEIDLVNATRSDLINFLLEKDFHVQEDVEEPVVCQSDKVNKMANALADAISKNPHLAKMLEKYI